MNRVTQIYVCTCGQQHAFAVQKEQETYIFLFDDRHTADVLRTIERYAVNEDFSFGWHDEAMLSKRIRELTAEARS